MIKAIAVDLDGTLLNSNHEISRKNIETLKKAKDKGIEIFIITGRTYESLKPYANALGIEGKIICFNGAKVVDGEEVIFEDPIPTEIAKECIELAREHDIHLNMYQNEKWYIDREREEAFEYSRTSGLDYIIRSYNDFDDYSMTKMLFIAEEERLKELDKKLKEKLNGKIHTAFSKPHFLEVLKAGVNKGITLKNILNNYNIGLDEVVAFGDGMNDYEMLELVKFGVCMENASPKLKEKIKLMTKSNDEDGVAHYLIENGIV